MLPSTESDDDRRGTRPRQAVFAGDLRQFLTSYPGVEDLGDVRPEWHGHADGLLIEASKGHYGGFDAFVLKWKQAIDEAPPNSLFALRSMNSVIHLAMLVSPQRERTQAAWLKTASTEELLKKAERLGAKIVGA